MAPPRWHPAAAAAVWLWRSLPAAVRGQQAVTQWSRLNSGSVCSDYGLESVQSSTECFNQAASYITPSLGGLPGVEFDGLGFNGCVYNTYAGILMFGYSPLVVDIPTYNYLCRGVPTSTTTTSTFTTPPTTVTITAAADGYTLIFANEGCADYKVDDVQSEEECFQQAAPYVGLGANQMLRLDEIGFTGCVHNTGNDYVFFGSTTGVYNTAPPFYRYICKGHATTTTTTSTTSATTMTSSTSTYTTQTSSTSTETSSTSTATTETSSTSTETSSTSTQTVTTTTDTGSTTTLTTQTFTSTTTSTYTTQTFTTITTTWTPPPWSGFVGDDPLTFYDNVMRKFWLPEDQLVPLFRTHELVLLGSARTVGTEQYIRRLAINGPSNESVLQISIRDGLDGYKSGDLDPGAFETLDVRLGEWAAPDGYHMAIMPGPDAYAHRWESLAFAFQRLADATIGEARAEMVMVGGESATIMIQSVAAIGFEGDLAAKHAHLDFVLQAKRRDTCEGILPELWGFKPISNDTLSMLEPPE